MSNRPPSHDDPAAHHTDTQRLEAFSDGVFAIAITLLVLELAVPALAEDNLLQALGSQWPSYLAYFVSFEIGRASCRERV